MRTTLLLAMGGAFGSVSRYHLGVLLVTRKVLA
jgi:fluoride ion exporter CrcB/FEX